MSKPLHDDRYIQDWLVSLKILHRGHWNASRWYEQLNLGLGVGTAVCAAISGTSAFAAFIGSASAFMAGGLGLISDPRGVADVVACLGVCSTAHRHCGSGWSRSFPWRYGASVP